MARETDLIELGDNVRFQDRWQGYISGFDVSDEMELLNVVVTSGILFFKQSVRLPATALKDWSNDWVDIDANSFAAFGREVPPVAVPSKPISGDSPVSHPGARLSGILVKQQGRLITEVLISRGGKRYRIAASDVRVEGNTITLGRHFEALPVYHGDSQLEGKLHDAIADDDYLTTDDKRSVSVYVDGGVAVIGGNVRVGETRDHVRAIIEGTPGLLGVRDESVDDISLEQAIGMALNKSGLQRRADVFARSNLGHVTLYGTSRSDELTGDVTREIARIHGVREVTSRLEPVAV